MFKIWPKLAALLPPAPGSCRNNAPISRLRAGFEYLPSFRSEAHEASGEPFERPKRTAVDTLREKLREREEPLQEDEEVKLATFEGDYDTAVEDVRDARLQAGQPPDEGDSGQTAEGDSATPGTTASRVQRRDPHQ